MRRGKDDVAREVARAAVAAWAGERPSLTEWDPTTTETLPVRFRPHFVKNALVGITMTAVVVAVLLIFGGLILAIVAALLGIIAILAILASAAVQSLTIEQHELVRRRTWGAVKRTPYADIAAIVYLPKYGERDRNAEIHHPFLVLLDAAGSRLHKFKATDWTERQISTLGALVPAPTKLVVPDFVTQRGLRTFDERFPGIRRRV